MCDSKELTIEVLVTCHNRKEKTLKCLDALFAQRSNNQFRLHAILVDDGSTDGTEYSIRSKFPNVKILKGHGELFWNRGMLKAWNYALTDKPNFVLWLNDDTTIEPDAIYKMLITHKSMVQKANRSGIVVGATQNSVGCLTYGGIVRPSKFHLTKFERLQLSPVSQPCTTMNGNCVLVSREVFETIGLLDECFHHGMGDFDYGLRATKAGYPISVAPGFVGHCENDNINAGGYKDKSLPFATRWEKILGPKGLPLNSWRIFCQRHAGVVWPLFWVWPYTKVLLSVLSRIRLGGKVF